MEEEASTPELMECMFGNAMAPFVLNFRLKPLMSRVPAGSDRICSPLPTHFGEDAFLTPTAEVPITNLHAQQVLEESDLPLSCVAWTPCFRAEAGSYGRDAKRLVRTHQFSKVALVKITTPATWDAAQKALRGHADVFVPKPARTVGMQKG